MEKTTQRGALWRVLLTIYYSADRIKKNVMGGACNTYGGLLWRPERNRPLGRPMNRWLDDIKMGLQGVGWKGTDWMALA